MYFPIIYSVRKALGLWIPKLWSRSDARSGRGVCGGQNGTGAGFLKVLQFPLPTIIPPTVLYSLIILSPVLYSLDTDSVVKQEKRLIFAVWTGCSICYFSWDFSRFSYSSMSLVIWDLTASANYKLKMGQPRTQAKLIIHQIAGKKCCWNFKS
jgi:hypothetical protein